MSGELHECSLLTMKKAARPVQPGGYSLRDSRRCSLGPAGPGIHCAIGERLAEAAPRFVVVAVNDPSCAKSPLDR
jgi:hypothetical protein